MGRSKRKKKNKQKSQGQSALLFGITETEKSGYLDTAKEGGLILLAALAAGGVGAALGKHSLLAGIPVTLLGIHKRNKYITAAGLGLTLSNGFQRPGQTTQGVDGFDVKLIAQEAKERVGTFFQNFKEKLYLTGSDSPGTSGLGEKDEEVTYFMNPYSGTGELDLSAIDRVQEQIADMSKDTSGLNEIEREF